MIDALADSLLADPAALPLMPGPSVQTWGHTVVIAPHPDDESLGCGGAIALLRRFGCPVRALMVSDGTRSHPNSPSYPAPRLRDVREAEAVAALSILGVEQNDIIFLRYGDCAVPFAGDPAFAEAVDRCANALTSFGAQTVLVPWRRDPHRDHQATWQIVDAVVAAMPTPPRVLEYPIWVWELAKREDAPTSADMSAWRLDIGATTEQKQAAIRAHVSQTTDLIDDDPDGFRLLPEVLAHFAEPWEIYLERRNDAATHRPVDSLPAAYFERKYQEHPDPWNFETSAYEAAKYAATLAALPQAQYHSAFEIGCSIGVLTAQLAPRCDHLVSIDVSEQALDRAQARCATLPQIEFAQMRVPDELPDRMFDLILVSEVGYYLSREDLERTRAYLVEHLLPGGTLLLVHWTPFVDEYPLTGDDVHDMFLERAAPHLAHLGGTREDVYRLDVFRRNT